ncbi:MAG: hypothetical protein LBN32_01035 [Helicobacteraceae bacterium]|jgi:hypothetical protein|nr:hypothetical protein [Helicobacteraceae bacterium]
MDEYDKKLISIIEEATKAGHKWSAASRSAVTRVIYSTIKKPPEIIRTCPVCGKSFATTHWRGTYCSETCCKKAYYLREQAKTRARSERS